MARIAFPAEHLALLIKSSVGFLLVCCVLITLLNYSWLSWKLYTLLHKPTSGTSENGFILQPLSLLITNTETERCSNNNNPTNTKNYVSEEDEYIKQNKTVYFRVSFNRNYKY